MDALPFRQVWCCDFEFSAPDGERPAVRCMVAREYHTGRTVRLWLDGGPPQSRPPFATDGDALFVAYSAVAEANCFLSLGWPLPARLLDLRVEFRWHVCGRLGEPNKPSLVSALDWFGLDSIGVDEKKEMQQLAIRGGPYTDAERQALLVYCESDVNALVRLLPKMLPHIDLPRAVLRGEFVKAAAWAEHNGIPIDVPTLALFDEHWESLRLDMIHAIDADYGVYDGVHFREERFARWLTRRGMAWPRRADGGLALDDKTFEDVAETFPALQPLRQLRQALSMLRLADLPVGRDGRNRTYLGPYRTATGRCAPSTTGFVLGRPAWMRSLIRPSPGRALAYVDWSSQEYGIGAVLSGDAAGIADYELGDPYLGFAKRIGMVPADATKETHGAERQMVKGLVLAIQYGMGEQALAVRIGKPVAYARELLRAHRLTYPKFWEWSDAAVNVALFHGRLWTRFGWQTRVRPAKRRRLSDEEPTDPNTRSLANFPCQGNGADMLRLAAGFICDAGVMLDATIHDAVLIEAGDADLDDVVDRTRWAMAKASELVLYGFRLRTDCEVVRWPDRYRDDRGAAFFDELLNRLAQRQRTYRPV
jgi:hypothetical protein